MADFDIRGGVPDAGSASRDPSPAVGEPSVLDPVKRDPTPSVDEPSVPDPAVRDDNADAPGVPDAVTPLVFAELALSDPVAVPGTHQTILLPRQSPAIEAAEGQRATVNPLSTTRIQSYSDTAAYVALPVALGNVLAKSVVKEGPVAPRARVRGMRGRAY